MGNDGISDGANGTLGRVVDESATVDVGLLEVEVKLLALVTGIRLEVGENLSLQAAGKGVVELNLGSKEVGRVPRLSDADACAFLRQQLEMYPACCKLPGRLNNVKDGRGESLRRVDRNI